jgi:hypothetical protein
MMISWWCGEWVLLANLARSYVTVKLRAGSGSVKLALRETGRMFGER